MSSPTVHLKSIKSHYLGGEDIDVSGLPVQDVQMVEHARPRRLDMNGTYRTGQIYVQEYRLAEPRHPYPLMLWHGGGVTGSQWEATPDGRHGWLWRYLQAGFDVIVTDAPERGRASWSMYPQVYRTSPVFRSKEEAWTLFRIGAAGTFSHDPAQRKAFAGQQFPVDAFDTFASQFVPRWVDHDAMTLAAYRHLLHWIGDCAIVAHSQGGGFATRLASEPDARVRAVVAIEPTGMQQTLPARAPAHLAVWGDHFGPHAGAWQDYRSRADAYWSGLQTIAGRADVIDLPRHGLPGNSHFCMLDRNSDQVADLTISWLVAHADRA